MDEPHVPLIAAHPLVAFLGITFGFSWSTWFLGSLVQSTQIALLGAIIVGGFGPGIAAIVVRWATGRSVRTWLVTLLRWRVAPRWYIAALFVPVLIYGIGAVVLIGAGATVQIDQIGWGVLVFLGGLPVATLFTGGNEELGWRGFLLPYLQQRYTAFQASVLVGLVWAGWHLPVYFLPLGLIEGSHILFVPFIVPVSIVLTWLYNSTEGSVLLAMVMHGSINSATGLFVGVLVVETVDEFVLWGARIVGVFGIVAVLLILYDRGTLSNQRKSTANVEVEQTTAE